MRHMIQLVKSNLKNDCLNEKNLLNMRYNILPAFKHFKDTT